MKKFKFRLQKVLDYRLAVEEIAKEAYLEARVARLAGELELQRIKDARKELLFQPFEGLQKRRELELALELSDDRERCQIALNRSLSEEEEAKRFEWLERKQEAEALSKLREKALDAYDLEVTRYEQKTLDEWAAMRRAA
jgi:flagellar FliJ protein